MVVYKIFGFLDQILYGFAATLYSLVFDIAGLKLFGDVFNEMTKRIYTVIATVMVFKILISCVTYMLTPDKILGKDEGVPSLFKNIIISIGLLLLVPTIFEVALDAQTEVASLIPQFILGVDEAAVSDRDSMGESVSLLVLRSFVTVRSRFSGTVTTAAFNSISNFSTEITSNCGDAIKNYFSFDECHYEYRAGISTVAGGFMCYILIGMTLDIAVRSIKLSLLELLAPIPITSYIDKKTKKTFDDWVKKCINIYVDLFIRIGALYLVLYIWIRIFGNDNAGLKTIIDSSGVPEGSFKESLLVIFIVLGALTFLKEAPKFLSDVLGLKENGSLKGMFTPFWKKGAFGAVGGMIAGTAMNAIGGYKEGVNGGKTFGSKLKGVLNGAYQGARGGISAGLRGGLAVAQGKNGSDVWKAGYGRSTEARHNRYLDREAGVSAIDRAKLKIYDSAHISTPETTMKERSEALGEASKAISSVKSEVKKVIEKRGDTRLSETSRNAYDTLTSAIDTGIHRAMGASGKPALQKIADSMEIGADGKYHMKSGAHLTFSDLYAARDAAKDAGINLNMDNVIGGAEKDIIIDVMAHRSVYDKTGAAINKYDLTDRANVEAPLLEAVEAANKTMATQASKIGTLDVKGTRRTGAQGLKDAFQTNYGDLDDALTRERARINQQAASNRDIQTRESINRRKSEKK